jgi:hypothetical protein
VAREQDTATDPGVIEATGLTAPDSGALPLTRSDPAMLAGSEVLGGPAGDHRAPGGWWTPLRIILVVGSVTFWLGFLRTWPCMSNGWIDPDRYEAMCYSDLPVLYSLRGLADGYCALPGVASELASRGSTRS